MVCTCQSIDLFLATIHRISCSILQRDPVEDEKITKKLMDTVEEKYAHDFKKIDHENCEYKREKAWTIDTDKIISNLGNADETEVDYYADVEILSREELAEIASDISTSFEGSKLTVAELNKTAVEQDII